MRLPSGIGMETLGITCGASGVLSLAAGALTLRWPPAVGQDSWSYPFPYGAGVALGVLLAIVHLMTLAGFVATKLISRTRAASTGASTAIVGFTLLAVAEIAGAVIGGQRTDSAAAGVVGTLFGLGSVLVSGGSIAAGASLARPYRQTTSPSGGGPADIGGVRLPASGTVRDDRNRTAVGSLVLLSGLTLLVLVTPANLSGDLAFRMAALMSWSVFFVPLGVLLARRVDPRLTPDRNLAPSRSG